MRNPSLPGPIAKDTEGEPATPADPELLVEILPLDGGLADQTGTEDVAGVGPLCAAFSLVSDTSPPSSAPQSQSGARKESPTHLPPPPPTALCLPVFAAFEHPGSGHPTADTTPSRIRTVKYPSRHSRQKTCPHWGNLTQRRPLRFCSMQIPHMNVSSANTACLCVASCRSNIGLRRAPSGFLDGKINLPWPSVGSPPSSRSAIPAIASLMRKSATSPPSDRAASAADLVRERRRSFINASAHAHSGSTSTATCEG